MGEILATERQMCLALGIYVPVADAGAGPGLVYRCDTVQQKDGEKESGD